jgi:hypothetical protein
MHGGARPGAGRPKGTKSKSYTKRCSRYQAAAVLAQRKLRKAGLTPFKGDAHALLVWVYQNPEVDFDSRLRAAIAAIPFEKPRLASLKHEIKPPQDMTDDELARHLAAARAAIIAERDGEEMPEPPSHRTDMPLDAMSVG